MQREPPVRVAFWAVMEEPVVSANIPKCCIYRLTVVVETFAEEALPTR